MPHAPYLRGAAPRVFGKATPKAQTKEGKDSEQVKEPKPHFPALRANGGDQEDAAEAFADDIEPQEPFRVVRERQVRMRVAGVQQGQALRSGAVHLRARQQSPGASWGQRRGWRRGAWGQPPWL